MLWRLLIFYSLLKRPFSGSRIPLSKQAQYFVEFKSLLSGEGRFYLIDHPLSILLWMRPIWLNPHVTD